MLGSQRARSKADHGVRLIVPLLEFRIFVSLLWACAVFKEDSGIEVTRRRSDAYVGISDECMFNCTTP